MYRPNYGYKEPYPQQGPPQNWYGPPQQQPSYMAQQQMQQGFSNTGQMNPSYQSNFSGQMCQSPMDQMYTPMMNQTNEYSQPANMCSVPQQHPYVTQHSHPQQAFYDTPSRNTMVPEGMINMGNYNQMGANQSVGQQQNLPASNQQQNNFLQQNKHLERISLRTTTYKYSKTVLITRGSIKTYASEEERS